MPKARDVRKSLPLTVADLHDLSLIRSAPEYRESLRRLTGAQLDDDTSEAAYLHAVLAAGIKVTREYAEASGYAEIAATQEPADQQRHQSARRRIPAWAKE